MKRKSMLDVILRGYNMGKCTICGEKIRYNRFKKISGKVYCLECAKKKAMNKIITPNEAAKDAMMRYGIKFLLQDVD